MGPFTGSRHGAFGLLALAAVACGDAATAVEAPPPAVAQTQTSAAETAQTQPLPRPRLTDFDASLAWRHLERIVALGPRPAGSPELARTRAYITEQLAAFRITVQEQRFTAQTPRGPAAMVNLIARLPGRRSDRILLTGHYDTKLMAGVRFVGASDGGSSAAWLIEAARVLALRRDREFTYEIVWLDGEEATCSGWTECGSATAPDNTYGSRHYVNAARSNKSVAAMRANILVDMIGDRDLTLRRDGNSTPWLVDIIWATARRLALDHIFVDQHTAVEDDHMPFLAAGVPSVDLIDLDTYPYWHTVDDTIDKLSPGSLQVVGDVVISALPDIEKRLASNSGPAAR